jgi:hypothetical protein
MNEQSHTFKQKQCQTLAWDFRKASECHDITVDNETHPVVLPSLSRVLREKAVILMCITLLERPLLSRTAPWAIACQTQNSITETKYLFEGRSPSVAPTATA